jgi:hypothetical protein
MNIGSTEALMRTLLNQGVHPLDLVVLLAHLDPRVYHDQQLQRQILELETFIASAKQDVSSEICRSMLDSVPFSHWGNSIFVELQKQ